MWQMTRRSFLEAALVAVPMERIGQGPANPAPSPVLVRAGEDRFGDHMGLGISTIDFKVSAAPQDPAVWRAHGMELLGPPLKV
jgi:hypothetical protein